MMVIRNNQQSISRTLDQWIKKLKCSGSSGIGIETFKDIRVGIDPTPVNKSCESFSIDENITITANVCDKAKEEEVKLRCSLGSGFDSGLWSLRDLSRKIKSISGSYEKGKLHGRAKIVFEDRHFLDGFFKAGVLHGFARYFDKKGRLIFVGNHRNGFPVDICWKIIRGGGCVVGTVDENGQMSGDNIAYIYPDYVTALVGTFTNGVMERGQEANVLAVEEDNAGIKIPLFSEPKGHVHKRLARSEFETGTENISCHVYFRRVNLIFSVTSD